MSDNKLKDGFTDDKRAELQRQIKAIDDSIETIEKQREPFDKAITALGLIRDELIDRDAGAEIVDTCEGCSRLIFVGELGHACHDGPTFCESCSPTWNDLKKEYEDIVDDDIDPEALSRKTIWARVACGDGDKKHVWELG